MSESTAPLSGFPRAPLFAVGGFVVATLLAVSAVRFTGVGVMRTADAPAVEAWFKARGFYASEDKDDRDDEDDTVLDRG